MNNKFVFFLGVLLLLVAAASAQFRPPCGEVRSLCMSDMECCSQYCDEGAEGTTEGFGLCRDWPFPNCKRYFEDCVSDDECCDGLCYHPPGVTYSYCDRPVTPPAPASAPTAIPDYCLRYPGIFSCPGPCPC